MAKPTLVECPVCGVCVSGGTAIETANTLYRHALRKGHEPLPYKRAFDEVVAQREQDRAGVSPAYYTPDLFAPAPPIKPPATTQELIDRAVEWCAPAVDSSRFKYWVCEIGNNAFEKILESFASAAGSEELYCRHAAGRFLAFSRVCSAVKRNQEKERERGQKTDTKRNDTEK